MARIGSGLATAFGADPAKLLALVKLQFDSGNVLLWTGIGDLTYGGETYTGAAGVMAFEFPTESAKVRANGGAITLNGLDAAILAIADTEPYQGRRATIRLGAFAADGTIVDTDIVFRGIMDVMESEDEAETARIVLRLESRLADLDRPRERRWTNEDQKLDWPDDKGFEFVTALADAEIQWGPNPAAPPASRKPGFFERLFG